MVSYIPILVFLVILFFIGLRQIYQYERGVKLRLGKYVSTVSPGLTYVIPLLETLQKVDVRTVTLDITPQDCMTKDNVPVKVNAVLYFNVATAESAVLEVQNYVYATSQFAMCTLRSVIGKAELDTLLTQRVSIAEDIRRIVDKYTDPWGIKVTGVEIKDIELPDSMKRAMAKQAEAERNRKAHIIKSLGELQAAENLAQAASNLSKVKGGLHLRTLETLSRIAPEPNTAIFVPIPIDVLKPYGEK